MKEFNASRQTCFASMIMWKEFRNLNKFIKTIWYDVIYGRKHACYFLLYNLSFVVYFENRHLYTTYIK